MKNRYRLIIFFTLLVIAGGFWLYLLSVESNSDPSHQRPILPLSVDYITEMRLIDSHNEHAMTLDDDGDWYYAGMERMDQGSASDYLEGVTQAVGMWTAGELPSGSDLIVTLIVREGGAVPVEITCYSSVGASDSFILHSSMSPEGYFVSDSSGAYDLLFGKLYRIIDAL